MRETGSAMRMSHSVHICKKCQDMMGVPSSLDKTQVVSSVRTARRFITYVNITRRAVASALPLPRIKRIISKL